MFPRTKILATVVCVIILVAISFFLFHATRQPVKVQMRTFKVEPMAFYQSINLPSDFKGDDSNISLAAQNFFKKVGIDLSARGRSIAFNDKLNLLFVKATTKELDAIERSIQALNRVAPQIHIKARFIEVSQDALNSIWKSGKVVAETETNTVEIISPDKFKPLMRQLQNDETETLAEPEVVTSSGRQTQMRATDIQSILLADTSNKPYVAPKKSEFEIGPTIDIVPNVLPDNFTIDLTAIPSIIQFLDYDKMAISTSPSFRIQEMTVHVKLWDNQTVVLGNLKSKFIGFTNGVETTNETKFTDAEKTGSVPNKTLIVFVTATIVDPAGNRVNSDKELRLVEKKNAIPPQK